MGLLPLKHSVIYFLKLNLYQNLNLNKCILILWLLYLSKLILFHLQILRNRIQWAEVSAWRRRTAKMKSNTIILCTDVHYHKPLRGDIEQHSLHLTANRHLLSLPDHHQHFQIWSWKDFMTQFCPTFRTMIDKDSLAKFSLHTFL